MNKKLLEIGCGRGDFINEFSKISTLMYKENFKYDSFKLMDISKNILKILRNKKIEFLTFMILFYRFKVYYARMIFENYII